MKTLHTIQNSSKVRAVLTAIFLLLLILPAEAVSQSLTITAPESGKNYIPGGSLVITWDDDSSFDQVGINLLDPNGNLVEVIDEFAPNWEWYNWSIPSGFTPDDYKVEVYHVVEFCMGDPGCGNYIRQSSDDESPVFSIGPATIAFEPEYDDNDVIAGEEFYFEWSHTLNGGNLELHSGFWPLELETHIATLPHTDSSYTWITPSGTFPDQISIRIRSAAHPQVEDFINVNLKRHIEVAEPANSSILPPGEPLDVQWATNWDGGNVQIDLYQDGSFNQTLVSSTPNTGSWSGNFPLSTGGNFQVMIKDNQSDTEGMSGNFEIISMIHDQQTPSATLVTFDSYNSWGNVTQATDANGVTITHFYGTNESPYTQAPNNSFRLTAVERSGWNIVCEDPPCFHEPVLIPTLSIEARYDTHSRITEIIDENEISTFFTYDGFHRLKEIKNHSSQTITEYDYVFWNEQQDSGIYDPDIPNYIQTLMYTGTETRTLAEYFDGLGRPIQTQQADGSEQIVTTMEYDGAGREFRSWKPYRQDTQDSYDSDYSTHAVNAYNNNWPFTEQLYDSSALNRPVKLIPEGGEAVSGIQLTEYWIEEWNGHTWLVTSHMDEEGNTTQTWADGWGRTVRTIADTAGVAAETHFEYDALGNLRKVTAPNGLETTYSYDVRGNLTERASPDAGVMRYKYDVAGNLRYSQDANQLAQGVVAFTQYDILARPVKSGLGPATFNELDPDTVVAFETSDSNLLSVNVYDKAPADSLYPWTQFQAQLGSAALNNLKGKTAATAYKSADVWQVTLYSYDQQGRVDEKHILTEGLPDMDALYTYSYNRLGEVVSTTVQVDGESFTHDYEYDLTGAMANVHTAANASPSGPPDLTYSYNAAGQVASRQFNGHTIDHGYTIRGWLESIGDVNGTALPFAANYEYLKNGNITFAEFRNDQFTGGGQDPYYRYDYTYDGMNRLTAAEAFDGQQVLLGYREQVSYDAAGNILQMYRTEEHPVLIDDLGYYYETGTNRLARVQQYTQTSPGGYEDAHQNIHINLADTGQMEVIISQVHYNSEHQANYSAAEFIELKNISGSTINLKDWQIEDADNANQLYRVLDDFYLPPGGRAVFANDQAGLYSQHYRYGYDFNLRDNSGQGQTPQGQTILVLRLADNADNALVLRRPNGTAEDYMSWTGTAYGGHTWNLTQGGDKTLALHRTQVDCATGCSKPADWATAPRAPYARNFYYDANGNLIIDKHKGIAANNNRGLHFWYDERNLPVQIGDFHYRYTADGQRYYKEVFGTQEYYLMDAEITTGVFENSGTGFELQHWNLLGLGVEGRYVPGSGYRYYYKDHLGSTRAVVNATGTILDATDYYPFGLAMPGRSHTTAPGTKEGFTGHERDDEVGLDYMVARRYSSELGRFMSVDPLADERLGLSSYNYVQNNPVNRIDPDGMLDQFLISEGEHAVVHVQQKGQDQYFFQDSDGQIRQLDPSNIGDLSIITEKMNSNDSFRSIASREGGVNAPREVAAEIGEINLRKGVSEGIQSGAKIGEAIGLGMQATGAVLGPAGAPIVGLGFGIEQSSNLVGVLSGNKSGIDAGIDFAQSVVARGTGHALDRVAKGTFERTVTSNVINKQFLIINFGIDQIQKDLKD